MDALAEDVYDLTFKSLFSGMVVGFNNFLSLFNMSYFVTVLVGYMSLIKASGQQDGNFFEVIGEGINQQIRPIKQPIDETIAYIGSKHCANVKKIFGVAYEQMEGTREPNLETLTLTFKTRTTRDVYNISTAAEEITKARAFDPKSKLIIFVHGFIDDPTKDSFMNISEAYLRSGESSVIALDGSSLIRWLYIRATTYVRFIGRKLGEVLAAMVERHIDFYPNGGNKQPGCLMQTCSHSRAWLYFAESVLELTAFVARRCDSWEDFQKGNCSDETAYMGQAAKKGPKGRYFLQTSARFPHGRGEDGLLYQEPPNLLQAIAGSILG